MRSRLSSIIVAVACISVGGKALAQGFPPEEAARRMTVAKGLKATLFASEPMDDADWQLLAPGESVHVDAELRIDRRIALPDPPKHQLRHQDLSAQAAASQHASVA